VSALPYLSAEDVRGLILRRVAAAGSFTALAREMGCSVQFVHRCATTAKAPSGKLLRMLGLRKAVIEIYLPTPEPALEAEDGAREISAV
jgi:hypothetical protein